MNEKVFNGKAEKLRNPMRVERLQIDRVLNYCLSGIDAMSALDVGTGTGLFAQAFSEAGLRVKGIDGNEDLLKIAAELVPNAEFKLGKAENLPFDRASFDLVFMGHVLHEVDDIGKAMHEALRVMRKRLAILEWPYIEEESGPPLEHRIPVTEVLRIAQETGFGIADSIKLKFMQLYILEK